MNTYASTLALVAILGLAMPAIAAEEHDSHHEPETASPQAGAEAALVDAIIRKVDVAGGKVTLSHGPLLNLKMPGMTMAFRVANPAWLEQMKAGDKIRFAAEKVDGAFTVTRFEPMSR